MENVNPETVSFSHLPISAHIHLIKFTFTQFSSHLPDSAHIYQILLTFAHFSSHLPNTTYIYPFQLTFDKCELEWVNVTGHG